MTRLERDFKKTILKESRCFYAPMANLIFGPEIMGGNSFNYSLDLVYKGLIKFTNEAEEKGYDGFVIGSYDSKYIDSLKKLKKFTGILLYTLLKKEIGIKKAKFEISQAFKRKWWFPFRNTKYFALVFAPFYPKTSPRFTFGINASFIIFQPSHSFDRKRAPLLDEEEWKKNREQIRNAHEKVGLTYDYELIDSDCEGAKFIEPLIKGEIVKWWENI